MSAVKKVLLVDDDATILRVGRSFIERLAVEVHQAASGNQARVLLAAGLRPDVVVTDLSMPDGSGAELLASVRSAAATRAVPVIVLTGTTDEKEVEALWALGCTEVYRKPVRYDALLERVAEHLGLPVRQARRFPVDFAAVLQLGGPVVEARALNLSNGGVYVESQRRVEARAVAEIVLKLPSANGAELVTLNVEVVRESRGADDSFGYGIRFLPGGDQRRLLDDYVELLET